LLIADAFNTANKCNLLPSELFEQRDVLMRVLNAISDHIEYLSNYEDFEYEEDEHWILIKNTINQIEQQTKMNE